MITENLKGNKLCLDQVLKGEGYNFDPTKIIIHQKLLIRALRQFENI